MRQDYYQQLVRLEARMQRMETMMQALLTRLDIRLEEVTPQESPEIVAVREALLSGNKINAIKLYRDFYGVGLAEAKNAVDAMEGNAYR